MQKLLGTRGIIRLLAKRRDHLPCATCRRNLHVGGCMQLLLGSGASCRNPATALSVQLAMLRLPVKGWA